MIGLNIDPELSAPKPKYIAVIYPFLQVISQWCFKHKLSSYASEQTPKCMHIVLC